MKKQTKKKRPRVTVTIQHKGRVEKFVMTGDDCVSVLISGSCLSRDYGRKSMKITYYNTRIDYNYGPPTEDTARPIRDFCETGILMR